MTSKLEIYENAKETLFSLAMAGHTHADLIGLAFPEEVVPMLEERGYVIEDGVVDLTKSPMFVVSDGAHALVYTHDSDIATHKAREISSHDDRVYYVCFARRRTSNYPLATFFHGELVQSVQNTDASKFDPTREAH